MKIKLNKLKVSQLNQILLQHGLRVGGNKEQKIAELTAALNTDEVDVEDDFFETTAESSMEMQCLKDMVTQLASSVQVLTQTVHTLSNNTAQISSQGHTVRSDDEVVSQNIQHQVSRNYSIREIVDALPDFDPLNGNITSSQFLEKVRQLRRAHAWSDENTVYAVQQCMKGVAKTWVDAQPVFTTMASFESAFTHDFPTTVNAAECHKEMIRRKRRYNEGHLQYYYEMLAIGRRGGVAEEIIISYIVDGINDSNLACTLKAMNINTCSELVRSLERATAKSANVNTGTPSVKLEGPNRKPANNDQNNGFNNVKCYNCNERGHYATKCPKPLRKPRCSKCNKIGHEANACRSVVNIVAQMEAKQQSKDVECPTVGSSAIKKVCIEKQGYYAFLDTGSDITMMAERRVPNDIKREQRVVKLKGFGGGEVVSSEYWKTIIEIDGCKLSAEIVIVNDDLIPYELLIGGDVLFQNGCSLTIESGVLMVKAATQFKFDVNEKLQAVKVDEVLNLLNGFKDCFAEDMANLGRCKFTEMKIKVTTDQPIVGKRYVVPLAQQPVLSSIVSDLLDHEIIRPSISPHSAPVVLVKKSNGEDRMCVDFRAVNAVTIKKQYPMPVIEEQMAKLSGKVYFTVLDMTSGYYQIPLSNESKQYTAFMTPDGLFEHNVMPFGLVNAPMVFQEMMTTLIRGLKSKRMIVNYVDEVIIAAETIDESYVVLKEFLEAVREAGLTLRPSKCKFMATKVSFLGHIISQGQISPGESKTEAVTKFPQLRSAVDVRKFLGLTGFFRKFIPRYGVIAKPLTKLLKSDTKFKWETEQEVAFQTLKDALTEKPVLVMFNLEAEHQVHTDACAIGLAGAMFQKENGQWKPVQYYSRQCSEAETSYASHELEVLAIVETLERFRVYLIGRHFQVITDCNAVVTTKAAKQLKPRIARWWLRLQEFDFDCIHRSGCKMQHVDGMSRAPVEKPIEPSSVADKVLLTRKVDDRGDWVYHMQMQDEKLRKICNILENKVEINTAIAKQIKLDYEMINNRLFRKQDDGKKLVVPKGVRWRITRACHDEVGHFALEKTIQRIKRNFWFPRMRCYVKSYISSCEECCVRKVKGGMSHSEMHIREIAPIPFRHLFVDHVGPFIRSKRGNSFLFVVVCGFCKYTILKPTRNTKTEPVLKALEDIMSIFGQPLCITSDRGTAFTSKKFAEFVDKHGIQHIKTAVRTPRGNGQVERANKTVLAALKCMTVEAKDWDNQIPVIQWSINVQQSNVTKYSPNDLVLRYNPRDVTQNRLIQALDDEDWQPAGDEDKYQQAHANIKQQQAKWKQRYDKMHLPPVKFEVGDLVMVENVSAATGQSRKLEPYYKGPYVITKCLDYDRYVVETLPDEAQQGRTYCGVHSSDHIKRWCALVPSLDGTDVEAESSGTDEESGTAEL